MKDRIKEEKKMKVIDLLNKIANGEEVPEKIKYNNREYKYSKDAKDYYDAGSIWLFYTHNIFIINDEIEIIEEPNKIEKLDIRQEKNINNNWKWKVYGKEHSYNISTPQKIIADKLNEIIDYINKGARIDG